MFSEDRIVHVTRVHSEASAGLHASRATATLSSARTRHPLLEKQLHSSVWIVAVFFALATVDYVHDIVDRDRRLCDICCDDYLTHAVWGVIEYDALLGRAQRAVQSNQV